MQGIVDNLGGNRSPWFITGKTGKVHKLSEHGSKKQKGSKKSEQFQLLIFGDSITKNKNPLATANCDEIQIVNFSEPLRRIMATSV